MSIASMGRMITQSSLFPKKMFMKCSGPTLSSKTVRGAARAGFPPPVIIAILQAIKTAGALQADLVIQ